MKRVYKITLSLFIGISLLSATLWLPGCGALGDPNRLKVAKFEDSYITRGNLMKMVHDMADDERPNLDTKSDWLKFLNEYIDKKISLPLGDQLAEEGKIRANREDAWNNVLLKAGEDAEMYKYIYFVELPEDGSIDPLMATYNLTPELLKTMKESIEDGINAEMRLLQAKLALEYLGQRDYEQGAIALNTNALEKEYEFLKPDLVKYEWIHFLGIRYPAQASNAIELASNVRTRVNEGEAFETITEKVLALPRTSNPHQPSVIESEIENNPKMERFRGFWTEASGAQVGDVLGPVFIPEYQQQTVNAQGKVVTQVMPSAFLVLKVLDHRPESQMTLEEAKPTLIPPLLAAEEMKKLREEHGVEIYRENLPDPTRM